MSFCGLGILHAVRVSLLARFELRKGKGKWKGRGREKGEGQEEGEGKGQGDGKWTGKETGDRTE